MCGARKEHKLNGIKRNRRRSSGSLRQHLSWCARQKRQKKRGKGGVSKKAGCRGRGTRACKMSRRLSRPICGISSQFVPRDFRTRSLLGRSLILQPCIMGLRLLRARLSKRTAARARGNARRCSQSHSCVFFAFLRVSLDSV